MKHLNDKKGWKPTRKAHLGQFGSAKQPISRAPGPLALARRAASLNLAATAGSAGDSSDGSAADSAGGPHGVSGSHGIRQTRGKTAAAELVQAATALVAVAASSSSSSSAIASQGAAAAVEAEAEAEAAAAAGGAAQWAYEEREG
jgi:hypothetical protein